MSGKRPLLESFIRSLRADVVPMAQQDPQSIQNIDSKLFSQKVYYYYYTEECAGYD